MKELRQKYATQSCLQVLLDTFIRLGWGLQGCWACAVAFQAIRLLTNSAWLLRPGSVLSRQTPLSDAPTAALVEELAGDGSSDSDSQTHEPVSWTVEPAAPAACNQPMESSV
jgi:hypothetical protein